MKALDFLIWQAFLLAIAVIVLSAPTFLGDPSLTPIRPIVNPYLISAWWALFVVFWVSVMLAIGISLGEHS